jgi:hypothetical protein
MPSQAVRPRIRDDLAHHGVAFVPSGPEHDVVSLPRR